MEAKDLKVELWREYDFSGRTCRIENPQSLWVGKETHRVSDGEGVVHCLPSPGLHGCVLRWKAKDPSRPVEF
jgi:hypothetical protein